MESWHLCTPCAELLNLIFATLNLSLAVLRGQVIGSLFCFTISSFSRLTIPC